MSKYDILICDDDTTVRESLKAYLEDSYELSFTKDGQETISSVKSNDFALIIIDIKIPGINGIETIRQIKELKPGQKIIVLTGYESTSIAEEVSKLGISSYLIKPVGQDKLLKAVKSAIA